MSFCHLYHFFKLEEIASSSYIINPEEKGKFSGLVALIEYDPSWLEELSEFR